MFILLIFCLSLNITVEISQNNHKLSGVIGIGINTIMSALSATVSNIEFLNFVKR